VRANEISMLNMPKLFAHRNSVEAWKGVRERKGREEGKGTGTEDRHRKSSSGQSEPVVAQDARQAK
jgi:hypothetical protein